MKSIYAKLIIWVFGTLALALAGFYFISNSFSVRGPHDFFHRLNRFQTDEADDSYIQGGRSGLAAYLKKIDRYFPGEHILCDATGRDLVTGTDRSALLREGKERGESRPAHSSHLAVALKAQTSENWLLVIADAPITPWTFFSFFALLLAVVAVLCWVLAANIGSPLRSLARVMDSFGKGDLGARAQLKRKDEIGEMARAFDGMAERIETLLTAERRLLRDISHELRSPLARLSFAAELTRTATDRDAAAERMKKEISRLTGLVGSLIEMTRAEGDPVSQTVNAVDLGHLLREIEADVRVEADVKRCTVVVDAEAGTISGDRELLRRAFENVIRNAIRYAPEDSIIDVTERTQDQRAIVTVRDFGRGVPEESLEKIFQPFFRVDNSRNSATGGVGLGLAITERAVLLHNGRISAKNAQPGLLVTLEMPAHEGLVSPRS